MRLRSAFSIWLLAFGILEGALEPSEAACPATLTNLLGSKKTSQIRTSIETAAAEFKPAGDVAPEEVAYTASETLPLLRRADFLNPVWPGARIFLDAYYGSQFATSSPDYQIFPSDETILCLLSVGRAVFLSDGTTHHYAVVYDVNYKARTVILIDPWASVSFLLPGHNLANVKAKIKKSKKGQPLIELSFAELQRVLKGSVEEFNPEVMLALLEVLDSKYLDSEDYLFWKYSRLISSSWQRSFLPAIDLINRKDLQSKPKLALLTSWTKDYISAVQSRFSIPEPGRSAQPAEVGALRSAYVERLPKYASQLPWIQRWLLLNRAQRSDDADIYDKTLASFVAASPSDVDLLIRQGVFLARQKRLDEATAVADRARLSWRSDVEQTIAAGSAEKAISFLFRKDYGLQTLAVLQWRNIRLKFLEREIHLNGATPTEDDHFAAMEELQLQYPISSILLDFFPEVIRDARLSHARAAFERYLLAITRLPDDERRIKIFARELYRHFNFDENIEILPAAVATSLRLSPIGVEACSLSGQYKPREFSALTRAFVTFCWPRAIALEGRWAESIGQCQGQFLDFRVMDDGMLEIRDQAGRRRIEWIENQGRKKDDSSVVGTTLQSTEFPAGPLSYSSKAQLSYRQAEPEEGFPVVLRSSQFKSGPYEVRDQSRFYISIDDKQIAVRESPALSGKGLNLTRCGSSASNIDFARLSPSNIPSQESTEPGSLGKLFRKASEVGAEGSRRRAYCGSFFAYSVDANLPSGEYITIKGADGSIN